MDELVGVSPLNEQKDNVKLNRGMNGKFGWEIKLYKEPGEIIDKTIERLVRLNDKFEKAFVNDAK